MELEFITWLRQRCRGQTGARDLIGDDAAVLPDDNGRANVVATDLLADGVHFRLADCGAELAGRKALAVNLSDMAAMGAVPRWALVSLLLPRADADTIARGCIEGMLTLANEFQVAIVGGDTNVWNGPLVINVAMLGDADPSRVWRRSGVQTDDILVVTGPLGGSLLGHHLRFTPRVALAQYLVQNYDVHAAIDISDGLSLDGLRLAQASGCAIELDQDAIPISDAAHEAARQAPERGSAWERAMHDGEDFELLLALTEQQAERLIQDREAPAGCTRIGRAVAGSGLRLRSPTGIVSPLEPRGYEH